MKHPTNHELNELVDGTIDRRAGERVRAHLKGCPSCTRSYRLLMLVDQGAKRQAVETVGPDFVGALMQKIASSPSPKIRPWFERVLKIGSNLVALLVVIGLAYGVIWLASVYLPKDSPAMQQVNEISVMREQIDGWWSGMAVKIAGFLRTQGLGKNASIWIFVPWTIILIVILDRLIGKRFRQLRM